MLCAAMVLAGTELWAGIMPADLKCGSWSNPLGIDDPNPRLSWRVVDAVDEERSQVETAWQIQVASSAALLTGNQPDLWDSGKVVSAQPFNVPYGGRALKSVQTVYWQVRVWDGSDQPSAWSPVAIWTMGLLQSSDWQGGWLTAPPEATNLPLFCRPFTVEPGLARALVFICGLGQYEFSVNGKKVGNALMSPGWTKYDRTCLYDTLDLTGYLTNGNNTAGVMLGNGRSARG